MIDIINLNKVFDNNYEALKSVNFHIDKGDLVCLLGPSGCGKSTILNMIAGLLHPTGGDIQVNGKSIIDTAPKDRNIGFVFQNYALYPHMTVLENVMFPLTVGKNKVKKAEAKERAQKYMQLTHIEELANKKPGQLSGGQQQRVAITRALIQQPDILLLDEPLSNLDAKLRLSIREEIRKLVKEVGITTIFVTHDQEEALSISDKIVLMNEGVIQQDDEPQNFYLDPANLFVAQFIGNPVMNIFDVEVKDNMIQHGDFNYPVSALNPQRLRRELTDGHYKFGIRPEDIKISQNGDMKANLINRELIGREQVLHCQCPNESLKVVRSIENTADLAEDVELSFNLDKAFIFDDKGERVY